MLAYKGETPAAKRSVGDKPGWRNCRGKTGRLRPPFSEARRADGVRRDVRVAFCPPNRLKRQPMVGFNVLKIELSRRLGAREAYKNSNYAT